MKRQWALLKPKLLLVMGSDGAKLALEGSRLVSCFKSILYVAVRGIGVAGRYRRINRDEPERRVCVGATSRPRDFLAESIPASVTRRFSLLLFAGMC